MLPTLTFQIPNGRDWAYETKMDGFRAIVTIDDELIMKSRRGNDLLLQFPEAKEFFEKEKDALKKLAPLIFDGELVILQTEWSSDFTTLQTRGRLRSQTKIEAIKKMKPATFIAFDLLMVQGKSLIHEPYVKRKKRLEQIFLDHHWPRRPNPKSSHFLQMLPGEDDFHQLWEQVVANGGEGIVAKLKNSKWDEGKRTTQWLKYKNWRKVECFITQYEKANGYFHVGVYHGEKVVPIGLFKHGMELEEREVLLSVMRLNSTKEDAQFIYVKPAICVEIKCLGLHEGTLREPYFSKFLLNHLPNECTLTKLKLATIHIPVEISHPEKRLWREKEYTKADYILYLEKIYPYMKPFLENRVLTVIRYPHGIFGEAFFQKNCPDYAPDFVETCEEDGIRYIVCNTLQTLLWLGNQLAIEFHIPFKQIHQKNPSEIVIDLDPPTKKEFPWALEAGQIMKQEILDPLGIHSFVKLSGNRGLQIYIPLGPVSTISWDETRLFTGFIADYLQTKNGDLFTTERLKKKRGHKLYIDYIQHAEGKTIVCPYSMRGNEKAGIASPLFWDELDAIKEPDSISIDEVFKRLEQKGDPFHDFFTVQNEAPLKEIIKFLKNQV